MIIVIANDHHGIEKKKMIEKYLTKKGHKIIDLGVNNTDIVDYPEYAFSLSNIMIEKKADLGILICGTGIGMSIAANRLKGIRCAKINNTRDAKLSKEHNDVNVLAIPSYLYDIKIKKMLNVFFKTSPSTLERYKRRNVMLDTYESGVGNDS